MQKTTPHDAAGTQADPDVLDWQEIKNLGIDPVPAGLTEDDQSQQG